MLWLPALRNQIHDLIFQGHIIIQRAGRLQYNGRLNTVSHAPADGQILVKCLHEQFSDIHGCNFFKSNRQGLTLLEVIKEFKKMDYNPCSNTKRNGRSQIHDPGKMAGCVLGRGGMGVVSREKYLHHPVKTPLYHLKTDADLC